MSYYGSMEDIKCKIGVTIWFELWLYDTIMTDNIYIENEPGQKISCWKRARSKREWAGPGQIISTREDLWF